MKHKATLFCRHRFQRGSISFLFLTEAALAVLAYGASNTPTNSNLSSKSVCSCSKKAAVFITAAFGVGLNIPFTYDGGVRPMQPVPAS